MSSVGNWRGPNIVKDGLVLYLNAGSPNSYYVDNFDDSLFKDISGNSYDNTLFNGVSFTSLNDGVMVLDGVDDYINKSSFISFDVNSISIWFKPTSTINSSSSIISLIQLRQNPTAQSLPDSAYYIALGSATNQLTNEYITIADLSLPSNKRTGVTDGGSFIGGSWYNLVINWESTSYAIYINNVKKTTVSSASGHPPKLTNSNLIYLGAVLGDGAATPIAYFSGSLSIIQIYNKVLSVSEMSQNYNATKTRFGL